MRLKRIRIHPIKSLPGHAVLGPTLISAATLQYLSEHLWLSEDELLRRLRINLLVDAPDGEPFGEEDWGAIVLGDVHLRMARRVTRCPVPGRDPDSES